MLGVEEWRRALHGRQELTSPWYDFTVKSRKNLDWRNDQRKDRRKDRKMWAHFAEELARSGCLIKIDEILISSGSWLVLLDTLLSVRGVSQIM